MGRTPGRIQQSGGRPLPVAAVLELASKTFINTSAISFSTFKFFEDGMGQAK
jgi:hypothetical protein